MTSTTAILARHGIALFSAQKREQIAQIIDLAGCAELLADSVMEAMLKDFAWMNSPVAGWVAFVTSGGDWVHRVQYLAEKHGVIEKQRKSKAPEVEHRTGKQIYFDMIRKNLDVFELASRTGMSVTEINYKLDEFMGENSTMRDPREPEEAADSGRDRDGSERQEAPEAPREGRARTQGEGRVRPRRANKEHGPRTAECGRANEEGRKPAVRKGGPSNRAPP